VHFHISAIKCSANGAVYISYTESPVVRDEMFSKNEIKEE